MENLSTRHYYAGRSIPTSTEGTIISTTKPSYYSRMVGSDHYAAIFNGENRNRFYFNGEETTQFISEGDSISDYKTYEEGTEHTHSFVLLDMVQ